MKKLILIDAYAMIYRAYYAFIKSPRINSKGINTSAIFGFVNTLVDVINKENPDYLGVAFDPKGGSFRTQLDENYKAQREKTPEDISIAVPIIKDILKAFNIPIFEVVGYEADDVIGTLALQASLHDDLETFMMTLDKDYGQLVRDNVRMLRPKHLGTGFDKLGPKEICEKHGIDTPLQVIDLLGLMGDASDNVPGCPGVGPKTAAQLIRDYGSIEGLLEHSSELKGTLKDKVESNADSIRLSKELVTIVTDVPVTLNLDELKYVEPNNDEVQRLFHELEFRGLTERVLKINNTEASLFSQAAPQPVRRQKPQDSGELDLFSSPEDNVVNNTQPNEATKYGNRIGDTLVGYDLKKAILEEWKKGNELEGPFFDIMLARYLLHPDIRIYDDGNYSAEIKAELEEDLKRDGLYRLFTKVEMPLMVVLARMERNGVLIDKNSLRETSKEFTLKINEIEKDIYRLAGMQFNISSPKQVGEVLFDNLKLSRHAKKTKSGHYVTSEEVLQELKEHEIVARILDYRGYKKLLSTYIDALPKMTDENGYLHTSFNQAVTVTGRLSSSTPNLQNIPIRDENGKEVRKAFIPDKNCMFFGADYSQIELRIMAHLSGDKNMIDAFNSGQDIHAATAAKVFKKPIEEVTPDERRKAKVANFGIIYGISTFGLAERMQVSRTEAKALIDEYFQTYPDVQAYMEKSKDMVREKGYAETLFGRRCYLPDINSQNSVVRGYAERNAINAPIQGSAADIIKIAMVNIDRRMQSAKMKSKMILQVHDELDFTVVPGEEETLEKLVIEEMQNVVKLKVPLIADAGWGLNWLEAH
ncbi:MAG: DNA polymerase I [Bacteroidaceae bacterium]|nr:DNA polymerase I [Bacteroidaceae bacterium]